MEQLSTEFCVFLVAGVKNGEWFFDTCIRSEVIYEDYGVCRLRVPSQREVMG